MGVVEITDPSDWDRFVAGHPAGGPSQSSGWGTFQASTAWDAVRLGIVEAGSLTGAVQVLGRRLPVGGSVAYVDRGPLVTGGIEPGVRALVRAILERLPGIRALIVDPPDSETLSALGESGFTRARFKATLSSTTVVDIGRADDDILADMRSSTRHNVRKALRSGLAIRMGGADDVGRFHALLEATGDRQGFSANSRDYLERFVAILGERDEGCMLLAEKGDEAVAGILVTAFGERAVYKRGAWSGEHGAMRPNEGLHWAAMQWARTRGCRWYDFDGVDADIAEEILGPGPPSERAQRSVTRFKLGFGGDVVELSPTLVFVPNPVLRFGHDRVLPLVSGSKTVKRALRRLRIA